jgi:hypothetical protein
VAFFQEKDIAPMLSQIGEPVTIAGVTANAIVRTPDEEVIPSELAPLVGRLIELTAKTGSFPGLVSGATVTRGAETYLVREFLRQRDGAVTKVLCARV